MKKISHFLIAVTLCVPGIIFAQTSPTPTATLPVIVTSVDVYDTSATIKGVVASFIVTPMALTYGTDRSIFPGEVFLLAGPDGKFTATMRGLAPNTRYYYQIASIDPILGRKSLTSIATFTTKSSVVDLHIEKVTPVSAVIAGKVTASLSRASFWIGPSSSATGRVFTPTIKSDGTFSQKVDGLTPESSYDVFMQSSNGVQLSGIRSFTTTSISVNPYIAQVSDTSATIAVGNASGIGSITVKYGLATDALSNQASMALSDGVYSAKLTGLTANTEYFYKLQITGSDASHTTKETDAYIFVTAQSGSKSVTPPLNKDQEPVQPTKTFVGKLVPCSGVEVSADGKTTTQTCSFNDVIKLFANVIDFLLFLIAPIIATALLLYGGILILFSGGSTENVSKAKGIFSKALIGLLLAMGAWLIVKFVMTKLGYNGAIFPTFY
jgi:hypothetical protein